MHGFACGSDLQVQVVSLELFYEVRAEMPLDTPCYALPAHVRDVKPEYPPFTGSVGDPLSHSLAIQIGIALLKFVQH